MGSTEQGQKRSGKQRVKHQGPKGNNQEWNEGAPLAFIVKGVQLYISLAKARKKKDPGGSAQDSIGQRIYQGIKKKKDNQESWVLRVGNSLKSVRIGKEENDGDTRFRIENYPGVDRKERDGRLFAFVITGLSGPRSAQRPKIRIRGWLVAWQIHPVTALGAPLQQ